MLESFKLLIQTLPIKARMDENYYVGAFDEGGACRGSCFALPGRELRIQCFVNNVFVSYDGEAIRDISLETQNMLVAFDWRAAKPIGAVDGLVRAVEPLHLTIFKETGYPPSDEP